LPPGRHRLELQIVQPIQGETRTIGFDEIRFKAKSS
jgi:hypothetical protein